MQPQFRFLRNRGWPGNAELFAAADEVGVGGGRRRERKAAAVLQEGANGPVRNHGVDKAAAEPFLRGVQNVGVEQEGLVGGLQGFNRVHEQDGTDQTGRPWTR